MQLRINILPPEKKQLLERHRWFLFLMVQCAQLLLLTVLALAIVLGIRWLLLFQVRSLESPLTVPQEAAVASQIAGYQDEVAGANRRVMEVEKMEQEHLYWSETLRRLEQILPEGTSIDQIGTNNYKVSLAGRAKDRDTLLQLRDRLSSDSCFTGVEVPLSNLFVQNDIDFQIDLTVKKECLKGQSL